MVKLEFHLLCTPKILCLLEKSTAAEAEAEVRVPGERGLERRFRPEERADNRRKNESQKESKLAAYGREGSGVIRMSFSPCSSKSSKFSVSQRRKRKAHFGENSPIVATRSANSKTGAYSKSLIFV